jgi:hypothetical protein
LVDEGRHNDPNLNILNILNYLIIWIYLDNSGYILIYLDISWYILIPLANSDRAGRAVSFLAAFPCF